MHLLKLVIVVEKVDKVGNIELIPRHLPFSGNNNAIVHFRHALSLDEHRIRFLPSFCTGGQTKGDKLTTELYAKKKRENVHRDASEEEQESAYNKMTGIETDVLEVFFAGAHCDVGGGSVANGTRHSLARIPLRWMIRECFRTKTGIIFDAHMLKHEVGLDVGPDFDSLLDVPARLKPTPATRIQLRGKPLGSKSFLKSTWSLISAPFIWFWSLFSKLHSKLRVPSHPNIPPPPEESRFIFEGEAEEELHDALSPVYDQMPLHLYWRIMEWLPTIIKRQSAEIDGSDDIWAYKCVWNRGAGRKVFTQVMRRGMKVHRSVKTRMEASKQGNLENYRPRIRPVIGNAARRLTIEEWVSDNPEFFEWVE